MSRKYWFLLLLSLLSVITFLDRNAISIAGILITKELGLSESQFGWILAAFTISYGLFEIPTGLWGDKFGVTAPPMRLAIQMKACALPRSSTENHLRMAMDVFG